MGVYVKIYGIFDSKDPSVVLPPLSSASLAKENEPISSGRILVSVMAGICGAVMILLFLITKRRVKNIRNASLMGKDHDLEDNLDLTNASVNTDEITAQSPLKNRMDHLVTVEHLGNSFQ